MSKFQFYVLKHNESLKEMNVNDDQIIFCLREDMWDDWFKYTTMYDLSLVSNRREKYIGKMKIGMFNMGDHTRPPIPNIFSQLDEKFFSVGQDSHYYENLNNIDRAVSKKTLEALNDLSYNKDLYKKALKEDVTVTSLLRNISRSTITGQYARIAHGGARLTPYHFKFRSNSFSSQNGPVELEFHVEPNALPPSNVHVLIGRNGVGKTHLISNMIQSILVKDSNVGAFIHYSSKDEAIDDQFNKVILVSFSAFDNLKISSRSSKYIHIGLPNVSPETTRYKQLTEDFAKSFRNCVKGPQLLLLRSTLETLSYDPIFSESNIISFCEADDYDDESLKNVFEKLSSGHKIILLSITKLIEVVEEKTLIFLDEPEGHLHPPLLAAYMRALSDLLLDRNGVAIIATHSPIILQEVPKKCVWRLGRTGGFCKADRLPKESFGGDITELTSAVFGLEITYSGYHNLLIKMVNEDDDYDMILNKFNHEIGAEGRALLKAIIAQNNNDGGQNE